MASVTPFSKTVKVANGAATSESIYCDDDAVVGVYTPAAVDSGTFVLEASEDGSTWFEVVMDAVTLAASKYVPIDPVLTIGVRHIRIKQSGNAGAQRSYILRVKNV